MKLLCTTCVILITAASICAQQVNGHTRLTRSEIREAESGLAQLGYWTGKIDGLFDQASRSALIAFQKWEGREVTGVLSREEIAAIRNATPPQARDSGYDHVEIDLDRQLLIIVGQQRQVKLLPVSTGTNKTFIDEGQESIAYTPRGRFVVYEKTFGWENGSLGSVYYANYISGGVAIHGSPNVPTTPASHGCIRIPMFAAREVSRLLTIGTIVLVYDRVSFVSAKEWIENPKLKEAAMVNAAALDYVWYQSKTKLGSDATKKLRLKVTRAD